MEQLSLRLERQRNPVADEVAALIAVIRPILMGTLLALKQDVAEGLGGYEKVKLYMLARTYRRGDGDCGICFEYAIHDALNRREPSVLERLEDSLRRCKVPGQDPSSILLGAEKAGRIELIETAQELLTPESQLLYGSRGRPVKLRKHLQSIYSAFRKRQDRELLPSSISGLWKADLFLGHTDTDRWVGTTVKINADHLEPAQGLRIGVVPQRQGKSDAITMDDRRNLVVCPVPYDGAFMETFYNGWGIVQQVLHADALMPREVHLPKPHERYVAQQLADRREFPVLDIVEALLPVAQPELLETDEHDAPVSPQRGGQEEVTTALAPLAQQQRVLTSRRRRRVRNP